MIVNKKEYIPPMVKMRVIELEQGIANTSVTPHIEASGEVIEEWEEEDVIFEKVEW